MGSKGMGISEIRRDGGDTPGRHNRVLGVQ